MSKAARNRAIRRYGRELALDELGSVTFGRTVARHIRRQHAKPRPGLLPPPPLRFRNDGTPVRVVGISGAAARAAKEAKLTRRRSR